MSISTKDILQNKLIARSDIHKVIETWRNEGDKIVFTNGVFDILHIGHVSYLAEAQTFGNKLILGLNSDASVKRLKGNDRPINTQDNRAQLLAALFFVDAVVIFDEDTPLNLIEEIIPDVLVKGADYTIENIVGSNVVIANGGRVETIKFIDGQSSTRIINQMKNI